MEIIKKNKFDIYLNIYIILLPSIIKSICFLIIIIYMMYPPIHKGKLVA